jgi:uncharacterized membrane protein YcgQ (UPF0703/DUF1980 family)
MGISSYLKEHLKWYINFLYNYFVSCLVFEINRLILIKSSVHSAILDMRIRYAYVTSRAKSEIFILQTHMSLSIRNSIFRSLFSTQLTHNILRNFSKKFSPTWRSFNLASSSSISWFTYFPKSLQLFFACKQILPDNLKAMPTEEAIVSPLCELLL